jgi:hypothetical protein
VVDEAVVEAVARDAHARVSQRLGAQLAAPHLEVDHREVRRAAAEVRPARWRCPRRLG